MVWADFCRRTAGFADFHLAEFVWTSQYMNDKTMYYEIKRSARVKFRYKSTNFISKKI